MVNLKKWFVCILFCLPMFVTALSVTPVKANTLDERVGALAVDTALSSFVDVLPPTETVEQLGGVQSWLGKIGQQFREAWETDGRNWQNFVDSVDGLVNDTFGGIFEVAENVVKDIRDVVYNSYNLIFGIDETVGGYDVSGLNPTIVSIIADYTNKHNNNPTQNYALAISPNYPTWYDIVNGYPSAIKINLNNIYYSGRYGFMFNSSSTYQNKEFLYSDSLVVLVWGTAEVVKGVSAFPSPTIVNMSTPAERVLFVPTVDNNYFNKYYFGFGSSSVVAPGRIVDNYETIYNYVINNNYTSAVGEIKTEKKGFWQRIVDAFGNVKINIGGFGGVDIEFPESDSFDSLYGDVDISEIMTVENSSWLSFFSMLPIEFITMFIMAVAVGCVCVIIKAVR